MTAAAERGQVRRTEHPFAREREALIKMNAITLGNRALTLIPQLFDRKYKYIMASYKGTFDYPFTRDAFYSSHFFRKAAEAIFPDREHFLTGQPQVTVSSDSPASAKSVWADVAQKIKASNRFFWDKQKPNGSLPHEMQLYEENHPFLLNKFYTWKDGDEFMINSDSIDATPRGLMEAANTLSPAEVVQFFPQMQKAFSWMEENMRENHGFVSFKGNRLGLMNQDWMDSQQGRPIDVSGEYIPGAVAASEVQGQAWSAMKRWAHLIKKTFPDTPENKQYLEYANSLEEQAQGLKLRFNQEFRTQEGYFANALVFPDGQDSPIQDKRISINLGFILEADHLGETILPQEAVKDVVGLLTSSTMFDKNAGIFTFDHSSVNDGQKPDGYHYGRAVVWPFASVLAAEGILKVSDALGWKEGQRLGKEVMLASLMPVLNTGTFLEQFTYIPSKTDNPYIRYQHKTADGTPKFSNVTQTWTVAAFLRGLAIFDMLNDLDYSNYEKGQELAELAPVRRGKAVTILLAK